MVYMIVDKKIELEIKYLKDYPAWSFLAEDELNRKQLKYLMIIKLLRDFVIRNKK